MFQQCCVLSDFCKLRHALLCRGSDAHLLLLLLEKSWSADAGNGVVDRRERREMCVEAGKAVVLVMAIPPISYLSSQPWPHSVMT